MRKPKAQPTFKLQDCQVHVCMRAVKDFSFIRLPDGVWLAVTLAHDDGTDRDLALSNPGHATCSRCSKPLGKAPAQPYRAAFPATPGGSLLDDNLKLYLDTKRP
jgi:hypothetical protein